MGKDEPQLGQLKGRISPLRSTLEASYARLREKLAYELRVLREEKQNVVPTVAYCKLASNGGRLPKAVAKQVANSTPVSLDRAQIIPCTHV